MNNDRVTDLAVKSGREQGLFGDTRRRLCRMAHRSAPVTSEHGTRRFHDWFLRIQEGVVTDVTRQFKS